MEAKFLMVSCVQNLHVSTAEHTTPGLALSSPQQLNLLDLMADSFLLGLANHGAAVNAAGGGFPACELAIAMPSRM